MAKEINSNRTSAETKALLLQIESMLNTLKVEMKDELAKTNENFEDYFVIRKANGRVFIHVSKLGRSELVKEKIKQVSENIKK